MSSGSPSRPPPSTLVEAARQALLAPFLVDKGRLPALLTEVADPLAALDGARSSAAVRPELPDVLGQRAGERVGERQHLGRAEARRLPASDPRQLADNLLEA